MGKRPDKYQYTETHEWVALDGSTARIGITDFAVAELHDLVFLEIKRKPGERVTAGEPFGEIESVKAVSDLISPMDGTVREVNRRLADELQLLASDPFGDGWLIQIDCAPGAKPAGLLSREKYDEHVKKARH